MNKYLRFLYVCIMSGLVLALQLAANGTASATASSQETKPISVTIQVKNKNMEDVFADLSAKTGLSFHYDKSDLNVKKKVTLSCVKLPLEEVLAQVTEQTGLKFTIKNNKIIVGAEQTSPSGPNASVTLVNGASLYKDIHGTVKDKQGNPIPGVTVMIKGTNKGTQTIGNGNYVLNANVGDVLIFRSVGYLSQEVIIGSGETYDVTLEENVKSLNEFVVTALGIQKKSKELTYATQQISGDELSKVKDANVINSIAGKVAGVTITRSASGVGGSARVVLRGNKSTRENQPLYIIDGVPMANFTPSQPTDVWGQSSGIQSTGGRDGGDGISNLNPDDIESMNFLKGASAAALYGSQAANGVIIITTKKGKAGRVRVDFSSDVTFESVNKTPKLQFKYGQTEKPSPGKAGSPESWGDVVNAPDHVKDFWNTGVTWNNALSISGGTDKAQTYFSYSNLDNKGILPTSELKRHTFNFRESLKLLNDKLTIDANMTFVRQESANRLSSGIYYNPLTGLYNFPRGLNYDDYANKFEEFVPKRNLVMQRWWNIGYNQTADGWGGRDDQQNPNWILYRTRMESSRDRGMASVSMKYQIADWLNVQARGSFDKSYDLYELKANAGTQIVIAPPNGRYINEKEGNTQLYADLILTANRQLNKHLKLGATLGTSVTDFKMHDRAFVGVNQNASPGLEYANKFSIANIQAKGLDAQQGIQQKQLQALFGSVQLGLNEYLYVDVTGRNDWSSTFAYTPTMSSGYFYYSLGLTAVVSDMVKLPEVVNFAKIRASYAQVGNDIAPYASRPGTFSQQIQNGKGNATLNTRNPLPGTYMKPEKNQSFEIGLETRLADDRVTFDFTYYVNNNHNQYMEVPAPVGSGSTIYYLNLGNIRNRGFEAMLTVTPVKTKSFSWNTSFNFASNKNTVVKLSDPSVPGALPSNRFTLTAFDVNMFGSFIKEGGSWGDIYSNRELKYNDKGQLLVEKDKDGNYIPQTNSLTQEPKKVGNPNPDFSLGWNNSFEFKDFFVSFLVDGKFGGKVMSVTQAVLDAYGTSQVSADARDAGGVKVNAVDVVTGNPVNVLRAKDYYFTTGGRAGIGELYMYDATTIRLRELAVSYKLPIRIKGLRDIKVGVIGRNLFFFKCDAPYDPEVSMGTGNGLQGIDVFGLPATRSIGVNLKVGF
ncbi:TonB-linked SusC/RagA family outer membrane protein [Chitinophaga skermanii]|uniref:TonB-linked SusC/RagA family outer membrane protein n=1 Tax=Chitinophaga skermanii TaxID=331697 RepID=A0A327QFM9_9BACT|nr:SusC/RagA family TonB-linked outer membrane protein [Chitinophaga skermanii]RAJ02584.1 TonB-linked SusC/RagA family outer membrane protein [Chitinophaga skermanii]